MPFDPTLSTGHGQMGKQTFRSTIHERAATYYVTKEIAFQDAEYNLSTNLIPSHDSSD